ncbi:MAG TPA: hypothetical protein VE343_05785 [Streptosporangiaceae bacterium]|jgi:protein-S-isoprenylcysteine O-methyltransferase Ste14|nr:hypothetical protein [Streptosporangiaceae bacterium]
MRRPAAAAGSVLFFAAAPGTVAGLIPWWLTGWRARGALTDWAPVRLAGLVVLGQPVLLGYAVLVWAVTAAFARWYEEPVLARQFGASYQAYRRNVRAWWPRARPWRPG